ncbi:hypothetical protein MKW92_012324 [Papaver armeniacum]|nr:hypothetical protein MKW92_012324 [Papaver armeniacum]
MKDPVYLPTSKTTVERCDIERHLRQYDEDPFNHEFLTRDMLVSDVELKAEIEDFIKSRKYNSQEQSMESEQSTTNETVPTEEATCQSSPPGAQNDSDPIKKIVLSIYPHQEYLHGVKFEKIPIEFIDPLAKTIMEDPVVLPSNFTVDRAVIRNHISKFHVDPFSGNYLTEDMLLSDDNLKARIKEFITSSEWQSMQNESEPEPDTTTRIYPTRPVWDIDLSDVVIPMEFLDSLEHTLLNDPVILPSGHTMDLFVFYVCICESSVDPFSGLYLGEGEVVLDDDLKERISEFVRLQSTKKKTVQTVSATYQGSLGPQNGSDPINKSVRDDKGFQNGAATKSLEKEKIIQRMTRELQMEEFYLQQLD